MGKPSAFDRERLIHINHLMDGFHSSCNEIYEHLVDRDFERLSSEINKLILELKELSASTGYDD